MWRPINTYFRHLEEEEENNRIRRVCNRHVDTDDLGADTVIEITNDIQ